MLNLDLRPDLSVLAPGEPAVRHLIARLQADRLPGHAESPPLDLALVVDTSGSMAGEPLAAALEAAAGVIRRLEDEDRLTLVTFDSMSRIHHASLVMSHGGRELALGTLSYLQSGGQTYLSGGYQAAAEQLLSSEAPAGRRKHLLLLSDGHANVGIHEPGALGELAAALLRRGLTTSCVGIGDHYSTPQLAALAEHGGGELHDAEHPAEIVEVVLGELQALGEVAAEGIELALDLPEGVTARDVSDRAALLDGRTLRCSLGQLYGGARRTLVLRLELPPQHDHSTVHLHARLSWRAPGGATTELERGVQLSVVPLPATRVSLHDARAVIHQWEAGLVRRVIAMNRDGAFDAIATLRRGEALEFIHYADQHLETQVSAHRMEQLLLHMSRSRGERMCKDMFTRASKFAKGVSDMRADQSAAWYDAM